jgi:hypothetical protein
VDKHNVFQGYRRGVMYYIPQNMLDIGHSSEVPLHMNSTLSTVEFHSTENIGCAGEFSSYALMEEYEHHEVNQGVMPSEVSFLFDSETMTHLRRTHNMADLLTKKVYVPRADQSEYYDIPNPLSDSDEDNSSDDSSDLDMPILDLFKRTKNAMTQRDEAVDTLLLESNLKIGEGVEDEKSRSGTIGVDSIINWGKYGVLRAYTRQEHKRKLALMNENGSSDS